MTPHYKQFFESIQEDEWPDRDHVYSNLEKRNLRPIAEVLALLDDSPYFDDDPELNPIYEHYLSDAYVLFNRYGGLSGQSGKMSFVSSYDIMDQIKVYWKWFKEAVFQSLFILGPMGVLGAIGLMM